ncbi:hypothetical protein QBC35DRAFT_502514 [Podospora australis]|uniref:Extracellular serine-rich protein n=1 Tax=Podospora australis TaxID=1536484 RepID=A0AAN6WPZ1_9PEZI|nr:hypothetical protein QBC35DRAFT_502514 [Podospora australis]
MLLPYSLGLVATMAATVMGQDQYTDGTTPTPTSSTTRTGTSTASSSTGPATVTIAVGREGHLFTPREAKANVGDIIKFNFYPGGHRVARAEFGWPCIPYEYVHENGGGFYTGVFTPQAILNPLPSYEVKVNDTEPIFFYCAAPASCTDWQMVGVINPNATFTLDAQIASAKEAQYQLEPGEPFPSETSKPRPSTSTSPAPAGTDPAASGNTDNNASTGSSSLSSGAIAGIAIGAAAVVLLAGALLFLCGRRGGFDKAYRRSTHAFGGNNGGPPPPGAMVDANYPKSPGQSTMSAFPGPNGQTYPHQDPYYKHGMSPVVAPYSPGGQHPGFVSQHHTGYSDVHSQGYPHSAHGTSPKPEMAPHFHPPPVQAPVELPSSEAPMSMAEHSPPPPQYPQGQDLWGGQGQDGHSPGCLPRAL